MDEIKFSRLCKDLYEPLLEKEREALQETISGITSGYASRGFQIPPGAMYADIGNFYKDALPIRARIVFDKCCEAYNGSVEKPCNEVFTKVIVGTIQVEQEIIETSVSRTFGFYNTRFMIPSFETTFERYQANILAEGKRQSQYYSSKAKVFVGSITASKQVDNPLELTPNFCSIGINLKRIVPWFKMKLKK